MGQRPLRSAFLDDFVDLFLMIERVHGQFIVDELGEKRFGKDLFEGFDAIEVTGVSGSFHRESELVLVSRNFCR